MRVHFQNFFHILRLSLKNVLATPLSTSLSLLLLALGVGMISLLMHVDRGLKSQLSSNIQGIDMVVGAKGSPLQLILSAVFQVDVPTGNIKLAEAEKLLKNRLIDYGIPLAYGDTYQGFRIVGTEQSYPQNYGMALQEGTLWEHSLEVSLGAEVARKTGLKLGDKFMGTHGLSAGGQVHEGQEYVVKGIFSPSGSVIDQLVLTGLQSVWDIHDSHSHVAHEEVQEVGEESHDHENDREITALLVKFKNPLGLVQLPRMVNENTSMQAALPSYELSKLFSLMGIATSTMNLVAFLVIVVSGISVFISLYLSIKDRKYEMALLRTYGASRTQLLGMILQEGILVAIAGFIFGMGVSRLGLVLLSLVLESSYHYTLFSFGMVPEEGYLLLITLAIGVLSALIPAIAVYRLELSKSLSDA